MRVGNDSLPEGGLEKFDHHRLERQPVVLSGCKEKAECTFCAQHITDWVGVIVPEGTIHLHNVTRHVDQFDSSPVASSTLHLLPQHTIANRTAATNTESKQP